MELTANDIRNYEFNSQMRGYSKDEVDDFMEQCAAALEGSRQEIQKLSVEIDSLKSQLSSLKTFEETIKNAAIDARRNADATVASAKEEAEAILRKARAEAEQALSSRTIQIQELEDQITKLGMSKKSYLGKLRSLIQSHLDLLNDIDGSEVEVDRQVEDFQVTDSAVVDGDHRETLASKPAEPAAIISEENEVTEDETESAEAEAEHTEVAEAKVEEEPAEEPKPSEDPNIDPELAAALENYQKKAQESDDDKSDHYKNAPKPGEFVETSSRAEDIPDGFIANMSGDRESTDRVPVQKDQNLGNTINADVSIDSKPGESPDIAKELDEVAQKFEEEMSKAEQSS